MSREKWFLHNTHAFLGGGNSNMFLFSSLFGEMIQFDEHISGQIIATSHDLTPNGGLVRENPLFQGNLGW